MELAEKLLGKGFELLIYDKDVVFSNLIGANRNYIKTHIPHLQKLLSDDLSYVIEQSEIIIVHQDYLEFSYLHKKCEKKIIIDLVGMKRNPNNKLYYGICW